MGYDNMLLAVIFVPVIGAFLLPLAGKVSSGFRNLLAFLFVAAPFALCARLIPVVLSGSQILVRRDFALGINFLLQADALAVFMACASGLISAVIVLYSIGYVSRYENQNEYYSMVVLFLGSMMGLIFSANLILLYIFWEMTAIASWRLIGFFRKKEHVLRADKAFLVTAFGALAMLIGFISLYQQAGSFDLPAIKEAFKLIPVSNAVILLILVGIFSKSATLPFHTWLPDAGVAPSPVTALLHAAVLVKIGVYVFARIFIVNIPLAHIWHIAVPVAALVSAVVSAGAALKETDLKRLIAYSTISQIGFIFFGLAVGNDVAVTGALLYILMHGLAKAGLFLCAGIVEQGAHTKDITRLGGLIKTMPVTAVAFLACALSVMGIPPFGGFFAKYMLFSGALKSGQLLISVLFLGGAFLTIMYLFRAFNMVFLGEAKTPEAKEAGPAMLFSVALLALLSLLGGVLITYPAYFANFTAWQMLGVFN